MKQGRTTGFSSDASWPVIRVHRRREASHQLGCIRRRSRTKTIERRGGTVHRLDPGAAGLIRSSWRRLGARSRPERVQASMEAALQLIWAHRAEDYPYARADGATGVRFQDVLGVVAWRIVLSRIGGFDDIPSLTHRIALQQSPCHLDRLRGVSQSTPGCHWLNRHGNVAWMSLLHIPFAVFGSPPDGRTIRADP
jgi:hypothetical protein